MITLVRNSQRMPARRGFQDICHSFGNNNCTGAPIEHFGSLIAFDEWKLPTGDTTEPHCENDAEIVTYIYKGALCQEDTSGNSGVIITGEFQRMSTGSRIRRKETSASRTDWVHVFQMSLRPSKPGIERDCEQKRFAVGQRRNTLCVVASPDGRRGSLRIHQNALIYSAILAPGHHLVHELLPHRMSWLHMIHGEAALNDIVLKSGDGVGLAHERCLSLTVQKDTEILLIDLDNEKPFGRSPGESSQ